MKLNAYTLPILISLALHALVMGFVLQNWESAPPKPRTKTPQHIQAEVVDFNPKAAEQAKKKEQQQRVIDMRQRQEQARQEEEERRRQQAAERRREQERQEEAERERQRQAEAKRKAEAKKREQQRREAEQRRQREEQLAKERERIRQQRLDEALAKEEEFLIEEQSREAAQSYVALIAQKVEQNWSRPPSARVGMQVVLLIHLVPTGQVVDVSVVESSGNEAFDRSAEQAVKRVDRFTEVQDMPPEVFERHFRQLRLVFMPKDLRL